MNDFNSGERSSQLYAEMFPGHNLITEVVFPENVNSYDLFRVFGLLSSYEKEFLKMNWKRGYRAQALLYHPDKIDLSKDLGKYIHPISSDERSPMQPETYKDTGVNMQLLNLIKNSLQEGSDTVDDWWDHYEIYVASRNSLRSEALAQEREAREARAQEENEAIDVVVLFINKKLSISTMASSMPIRDIPEAYADLNSTSNSFVNAGNNLLDIDTSPFMPVCLVIWKSHYNKVFHYFFL